MTPISLIAGRTVPLTTLALVTCLHGCASYSYERLNIVTIDGESGTPVNNARVTVRYIQKFRPLNPPANVDVRTREDGTATVRVADFGPQWKVTAPGYLTFHSSGYRMATTRLPDVFYRRPSKTVEIPLYRTPQPIVNVIVPNGYRGPLKVVRLPVDGSIQEHPGQRRFLFSASLC